MGKVIQITCPVCNSIRIVQDHPRYKTLGGLRICRFCANNKRFGGEAIFVDGKPVRKISREIVECPVCHIARNVLIHKGIGTKLCHSCAGKEMSTADGWKSHKSKRSDSRWTSVLREKQSDMSRKQVLAQGGIPNAVRLTSDDLQGDGNPNWKGGITPENVKERTSPEYRAWVKAVFYRDNHTCQVCLKRGGKLHAHHIKSFSSHPELRLDLDNGMTACKWCHTEILHKGSWQNAPIPLAEILQIQAMVRDGTLMLDWEEAA